MRVFIAIAVLAAALVAVVAADNLSAPDHWRRVSAVREALARDAAPSTVTVMLALAQRNRHELESELMAVSDPRSPRYGQHKTHAEIIERYGASDATIEHVRAVFTREGVRDEHFELSKSRDFATVVLSVDTAERMFGVSLSLYEHKTAARTLHRIVADAEPVVPNDLMGHIDFVGGLSTRLPRLRSAVLPEFESRLSEEEHFASLRSLRAQAERRAADPSAASSSPYVQLIKARNNFAITTMVPVCSDGTYVGPTNCAGTSNGSLTTVVVTASAPTIAPTTWTYNSGSVCAPCTSLLAQNTCVSLQQTLPGFDASSSLVCQFTVDGLPNFVPISMSFAVSYSSGVTSDVGRLRDKQGNALNTYTADWTTPITLKRSYSIPDGARGRAPNNSMSVVEFLGQYYSPSDMQGFLDGLGVNSLIDNITLLGPNDPSNPGGEAMLDIEYIMGLAPNIKTVFWSVGTYGPYPDGNGAPQEDFLNWVYAVSNSSDIPYVHSVSYSDAENSLPRNYTDRLNDEFMKLGMRGVTVLIASGDDGTGGYLTRNDVKQCEPFVPQFPSCSPWVTSVGGTQLLRTGTPMAMQYPHDWLGPLREVMCDSRTSGVITSGGGFSNYYAAPSYQVRAVQQYLNRSSILPPSNLFRADGRAYPDISASSHNYLVMLNGGWSAIFGTSASTPTVAAIVALLNDLRLFLGQSPVGFINPVMYMLHAEAPGTFNDVVVGDNRCSTNYFDCCTHGFKASPGWDPVTGVGTPNFLELVRWTEAITPRPAPPIYDNAISGFVLGLIAVIGDVVLVVCTIVLCVRIRRAGAGEGENARLVGRGTPSETGLPMRY